MSAYTYYLSFSSPTDCHGSAVDVVMEEQDGTMWVTNLEYATQVNYCPITGRKARTQINDLKIHEKD